jgi:hypothetical protein
MEIWHRATPSAAAALLLVDLNLLVVVVAAAVARVKVKAIPLRAWIGPEISRSLRLPDFKAIGK